MKTLDIDWLISANHLTIKIQPYPLRVPASDDLNETEQACMVEIEEYAEDLKEEVSKYFTELRNQEIDGSIEYYAKIFKPIKVK